MKAHTRETQATMTPQKSLNYLKEGNIRFQNNLKANRNLLQQVNDTSSGQFPFATNIELYRLTRICRIGFRSRVRRCF